MYCLNETSLSLWSMRVPDWRWQLDELAPTPLEALIAPEVLDATAQPSPDVPDAADTPATPDDGGQAAGVLAAPVQPVAVAPVVVVPVTAAPAACESPEEHEQQPVRAGKASPLPPPAGSGPGHWVLVGMKTQWYSTLVHNPIAGMTRQLAVQEDADADHRRALRDRLVWPREPSPAKLP